MRLRQKFYNNRKRKKSCLEVVVTHKHKDTKTDLETSSKRKAYYVPAKPDGEDDTSTRMNKEWLQSKHKSRKKDDMNAVNMLMERTLHERRKMIITDGSQSKTY